VTQRRTGRIHRASNGERTLPFDWHAACAHVSAADTKLAELIERVGAVRLEIQRAASPFESLVRSIVYQQLSGKAASTIHGRLAALFPAGRVQPEPLLAHADDALRAAGLSRGKIAALRDLAVRTLDGTVPRAEELDAMADDEIVERLVRVRGVGRWTAEMLLIFGLGRPDVLPVHDYGVRQGFKLTYRKRTMPTAAQLARQGERWRPFRTVASWYMWRAVELARRAELGGPDGL
jgi:3-methyladenine DNA glycosylase/8-oxoguanine DNA glycosylase